METEFRTVLLCRDGWSHQEASFCIFTCFRRFAIGRTGRSSVWCDGVLLIKLVSSPEPLKLPFCVQSVPAHLTASFYEPGGKGLKRVRWRICYGFAAWKAPRQAPALLLCCSGLTALSPGGPELQVCPAHCSFQWFWALHLTKKAALKWLSTFLQSAFYQPDIDCGMQWLLLIVKKTTLFWKSYTITFSL